MNGGGDTMNRLRITKVLVVAAVGLAVAAGSVAALAASDGGDEPASRRAAAQEQTPDESPTNDASPWLGVLARPSDEPPGLLIRQVVPDSPAANAGLAEGDVITAIDGQAVTEFEALRDAVGAQAPGDTVTLSVVKDGRDNPDAEAGDVQVTLGERPEGFGFKERIGDGIGKLFDRFVDGQFRYLDENGNTVAVEVVAGTVTAASADEITIDVNGGDEGERSFSIPEGVEVPEGLAEGDRAAVVVKDGSVAHILSGGFHLPLPCLLPDVLPDLDGGFNLPLGPEGSAMSVEVVSGTVSSVSADEITLNLGTGQGEKTLTIPDGVKVPEGLQAGEEATVVVHDGNVAMIIEGDLPINGQFEFPNPFRDGGWSPFPKPSPEQQESVPEA
jgi:membrane-associated protease RseP (regulator of RpoE activity)